MKKHLIIQGQEINEQLDKRTEFIPPPQVLFYNYSRHATKIAIAQKKLCGWELKGQKEIFSKPLNSGGD